MQAQYRRNVRAGGEQRVPVARVDRWHAQRGRVLGERRRVAPLVGQAAYFLCRLVHVEQRKDAAWDEPFGIGGAPLIDMPVVVRLDHDFVQLQVRTLFQDLAGEPGPVGEVQTGELTSR